jgi:hypothetical protein
MSDEKLSLELKYNELLEKYNELETQHQLLKNTTGKKIKLLNDQLRHYRSKCQQFCKQEKEETNAMKKFFTKNQMDILSFPTSYSNTFLTLTSSKHSTTVFSKSFIDSPANCINFKIFVKIPLVIFSLLAHRLREDKPGRGNCNVCTFNIKI